MPDEAAIENIKAIQTRHTDQLMSLPNVIGISIGQREPEEDQDGDYVIVVLVDRLRDNENVPMEERIPNELDGVPVLVRQVGTFEAL